jgi:ankyrin repeat protein
MKKINQVILFSLFIPCFSHAMLPPLHQAVQDGNLEKVQQLLERDTNINATTNSGLTPLQLADTSGNLAIFNSLLGLPKARKEQMFAFLRTTHSPNSPAKILYRDALYLIWKHFVKPTIE